MIYNAIYRTFRSFRSFKCFGALLTFPILLSSSLATALERVPFLYQVSGQECLAPVTVKYRDVSHRDYAINRIFKSFSELALEREKTDPLPTAGWAPALHDLFFLHFAGDCENRFKWAQILVDDYHGRFPDDAQLTISQYRSVPKSFFDRYFFRRIEPVYSILDCRVSVRNTGAEVHPSYLSAALFAAQKDFYTLTENWALKIRYENGSRGDEFKLVLLTQCEKRGDIAKSIAKRAMELDPALKLKVREIGPNEDRGDLDMKSDVFRDTRNGLQDYLPPRHDVK